MLGALAAFVAIIGLVVFSQVAENSGRKQVVSWAWMYTTVGLALLAFSNGLVMVGCGYFMIGFGINAVTVLDFAFINESSMGKALQYYSGGIQLSLPLWNAS